MPESDRPAPTTAASERIRAAAVELFAAKGFAATGIRDIAETSGLSTSSLYNYMSSKDDLLVEIMIGNLAVAGTAADRTLAGLDDPVHRLIALIRCHVHVQLEYPLEAIITDNEIRSLSGNSLTRVIKERDAYEDRWREILGQGASAGRFSLSEPSVLRTVLVEACNGVGRWYRADGALSRSDIADEMATLGLKMVSAKLGRRPAVVKDAAGPTSDEIRAIVAGVFAERRAGRG